MKALRLPGWLETSVLARYQAKASHLFLLHGNVRDLQPFGADYVPLGEGLKRLCARRDVLALYDVSSGLSFGSAAQEKAFRKALGFKGPLPSDPARALVLLDALVTSEKIGPGRVAVVLDYAHALAPSGPASSTERAAITTLSRWATEAKIAERRPFIVLIAPAAGDVSDEVFAGGSAAEVVEVPKPDPEARADFARVLQERFPEVRWETLPSGSRRKREACPSPRWKTSCSARRAHG